MKTVQYYLKKLKTKKLVETYFNIYPINYEENTKLHNLSVMQIKFLHIKMLRKFIKKLRKIKIQIKKREMIFFGYKGIEDDDMPKATFDLIYLDEFFQNGDKVQGYAYEYNDWGEIMGYFVADTEFTQFYIYELMAEILFEASFFGYKRKSTAKQRKKLNKRMKEVDTKKTKTVPFKFEMPDEPLYKDTPESKEMEYKIMQIKGNYNIYHKNKELENLKNSLKNKE